VKKRAFQVKKRNCEAVSANKGLPIKFCSITEAIAKLDLPIIAASSGGAIRQYSELKSACDTASEGMMICPGKKMKVQEHKPLPSSNYILQVCVFEKDE
jgi:hypothetical protein